MTEAPEETTLAPAGSKRVPGAVKVTAALAAGALLVGGGATLARWYDSEDLTASVTTARSEFTLTHDGQTHQGEARRYWYEAVVDVGPALARELVETGEPVRRQFDLYSMAEGNLGLENGVWLLPGGLLSELEGKTWVSADGTCDGPVPETAETITPTDLGHHVVDLEHVEPNPEHTEVENTVCVEYQPADLGAHQNEVTVTGQASTGSGTSTEVSAVDDHELAVGFSADEVEAATFEVYAEASFDEKCFFPR